MKKRIIAGLVMMLLAAALFAPGIKAEAAAKKTSLKNGSAFAVPSTAYTARTTGRLNMRKARTTEAANVITTIPKNTVVAIKARYSNNWFGVMYKGKAGYVKGGLLGENKDKLVTTAKLNMRSTMDSTRTDNKIGKIPKGGAVEVMTRYKNGWYLVNYKGKSGYCSAKYLAKPSEAKTTVKVTTGKLRLRSSKDQKSTSNIILIIPKGHQVTVISEEDKGWVKVTYSGKTGYVVAKYLKNSEASDDTKKTGTVKVMAENLKVRSSKSKTSDANVIGYVKKGQSVTVLAKYTSGWVKIQFEGKEAYIMGGHFTDDATRVGTG